MDKRELKGLSLFMGKDFVLTDKVSVKHPKLFEIEEIGEDRYAELLSCMTSTSVDVADILWFDMKIWYEDISDEWDFFLQKCLSENREISISLKDTDGQRVIEKNCIAVDELYRDAFNFFFQLSGEYIILRRTINGITQDIIYNVEFDSEEDGTKYYTFSEESFKFTKFFYELSARFLSDINWAKKDYDFLKGGNKSAKKYILQNTLYKDRKKKKDSSITLQSIVSGLVAKGFPYKEIWDLPIYCVYEIYYRLVKIEEYNNTMTALYNGCIDTKKNPINWDKINWANVIT